MKKLVYVLLCVCLIVNLLPASAFGNEVDDTKSMLEPNYITELKYDYVGHFSDGMAYVRRDGKHFYIDRTGKEVIELPYENCSGNEFYDGKAWVRNGNFVIFIDKSGSELARVYTETFTTDYGNGFIEITENGSDYNYFDYMGNKYNYSSIGRLIGEGIETFGYVEINGERVYRHGAMDKSGKEIVKLEYDDIEILEEYVLARKVDDWGVYDQKGNLLISPAYKSIKILPNGYISVVDWNNRWGLFDPKGTEIIKAGEYYLSDTTDESLIIANQNTFKLIDMEGNTLFENNYTMRDFSGGYSATKKDENVVFVDTKGNEVYKYKSRGFHSYEFNEGILAIKKDSNWIIIDEELNEIANIKDNKYSIIEKFSDGMAITMINGGKCGYIDNKGNEIIPPTYDWVSSFKYGLAIIKGENGKYGCIDKNGNIAIETQYDRVNLGSGFVIVRKGDLYGMLDSTGNEILEIKYRNIYMCKDTDAFVEVWGEDGTFYTNKSGDRYEDVSVRGDGYVNVYKDVKSEISDIYYSRTGLFDNFGNEKLPIEYGMISHFDGDHSYGAKVRLNNDEGFIDRDLNVVIPTEYDYIGVFDNGIAKAEKDDKHGYIDEEGNYVIPPIFDDAYSFYEGIARVCIDGKWGFIAHPYK